MQKYGETDGPDHLPGIPALDPYGDLCPLAQHRKAAAHRQKDRQERKPGSLSFGGNGSEKLGIDFPLENEDGKKYEGSQCQP
jgi:hypothetical protein